MGLTFHQHSLQVKLILKLFFSILKFIFLVIIFYWSIVALQLCYFLL